MDYADYSKMLVRANASYEKRQIEKALQKKHQPGAPAKTVKIYKNRTSILLYTINLLDFFKKIFTPTINPKKHIS